MGLLTPQLTLARSSRTVCEIWRNLQVLPEAQRPSAVIRERPFRLLADLIVGLSRDFSGRLSTAPSCSFLLALTYALRGKRISRWSYQTHWRFTSSDSTRSCTVRLDRVDSGCLCRQYDLVLEKFKQLLGLAEHSEAVAGVADQPFSNLPAVGSIRAATGPLDRRRPHRRKRSPWSMTCKIIEQRVSAQRDCGDRLSVQV